MLTPQQISQIKAVANPASSPSTPMTPDQAKTSFSSSNSKPTITQGDLNIPALNGTTIASQVPGAIKSLYNTTVQNTKNQQQTSFNNIGSDITNGANDIQQGGDALAKGDVGGAIKSGIKAGVQGGLGTVSDAIQYFFAPLAGATKTMTDTVSGVNPDTGGLGINDIPVVKDMANGSMGDNVQAAQDALTRVAQANPILAKALTDAFVAATTAIGGGKAPEALDQLGTGVSEDLSTISNGTNPPPPSGPTSQVIPPPEPPDTLVKESGQVDPVKAQDLAWKDIQPKATPTTKLAYAKQGNTTAQGLVTSGKITPSVADTKLIADYSKLYEDGTVNDSMTPQEKQAAVSQKAAQLNGQQKEFLASHDKAVTLSDPKGKTGLFDQLDATAKKSSMPFSKDPSTKGAYDSVIEVYKSLLDTGKSAGTVSGASTLTRLDSALSALDSEMDKFGAWGKTKTGDITDTAMARQQAIRDVHTTVRDYIASQLPKNSPWQAIRLEESNMYQIGDRLAQRSADTVGTSRAGTIIKNNPVIKTAINAGSAVTGGAVGAASRLIP